MFDAINRGTGGGLTAAERDVLLALLSYADKELIAWPSWATLAADTGRSRSKIGDRLKSLEQKQFIIAVARGGGRGRATRYRINIDRLRSADEQYRNRRKQATRRKPTQSRNGPEKGTVLDRETVPERGPFEQLNSPVSGEKTVPFAEHDPPHRTSPSSSSDDDEDRSDFKSSTDDGTESSDGPSAVAARSVSVETVEKIIDQWDRDTGRQSRGWLKSRIRKALTDAADTGLDEDHLQMGLDRWQATCTWGEVDRLGPMFGDAETDRQIRASRLPEYMRYG